MRQSREEYNAFRRQATKRNKPKAPPPDEAPDPEWMTLAETAAALGVTKDALQVNHHRTYSWLPLPVVVPDAPQGRCRLLWPRADTLAALARPRPRLPIGWHPLPLPPPWEGVTAHVRVKQPGARPSVVRLSGVPTSDGAASAIGDAVELAIERHYGCRRLIDARIADGEWPLVDHVADHPQAW